MNIHFGRELILRNIKTHGQTFTFKRTETNRYGEPTGANTEVVSVQGLFHQSRGYITKTVSDGTVSRGKPQPQILCLLDAAVKLIQQGDTLNYMDQVYTVTGVDDVNNLGIACEISLELFDNGA